MKKIIARLLFFLFAGPIAAQMATNVTALTVNDVVALEIDGFDQVTTVVGAIRVALSAGLAFLIGATVPILISVITPVSWRDEYTIVAVAVALGFTSIVLARLGHTRIWQTLARSILIGLAALGSSYLIGSVLL